MVAKIKKIPANNSMIAIIRRFATQFLKATQKHKMAKIPKKSHIINSSQQS